MNPTEEPARRRLRAIGVLGIVGGLALLAAFILDLSTAQNTVRILLFLSGTVAVALVAFEPQAALGRRPALAGAVPLILTSVMTGAWVLLSIGRDRPFAGDFGLVGFYAGLGLWLAQAWYGIVALRIGVPWRWAALLLAVGSFLAITGIDRLALTSPANPTIFGLLSQLGIALNGVAWVLLGLEMVAPPITPAIFRRHRA
jgi:hypothetical protein